MALEPGHVCQGLGPQSSGCDFQNEILALITQIAAVVQLPLIILIIRIIVFRLFSSMSLPVLMIIASYHFHNHKLIILSN